VVVEGLSAACAARHLRLSKLAENAQELRFREG
jgi:hypothetical protein